jgi:hypothetical protein
MFISLAYHSVIGISFALYQSDPIKRRPLCYFFVSKLFNQNSQSEIQHKVVLATFSTHTVKKHTIEVFLSQIFYFGVCQGQVRLV